MHLGLKNISAKKTFILLLGGWFILNLLQAIFTGMSNDESYYALWGRHLAWGYFDHPPMVAVFNYLSSLLFTGNLGVRFMTVLAQIGTMLLIWKIIDDKVASSKNVWIFFILAASMVMFATLGFVTTPDAPLLFFVALFLFSYQRFLKKETLLNTLLLCLSMAGMVYSKYQSSLVIIFIVISNLRLLLKPKFWLAGLSALALLVPHFYWQYSNHFPSLQYHLVDRGSQFRLNFFLEYIPNQLAIFNPFTFGLMVYVLFKHRAKEVFERGLYFLIIGFIGFFWVMSYRGHVEPHWTVACSIPILVLLYKMATTFEGIRMYVNRYIIGSLAIILIARVALVIPPLADRLGFGNGEKFLAIESIAGSRPTVFAGSFQKPSQYTFFTGSPSVTLNSIHSRRTQFDIWQWERSFENKPVFVCADVEGKSQTYQVNGHTFKGFLTDHFHSAIRLKLTTSLPNELVMHRGDTIRASFALFNPYAYTVDFKDNTFPVELCACYFTKKIKEVRPLVSTLDITLLNKNQTVTGRFYTVVPDLPEGHYTFSVTTQGLFGPVLENALIPFKMLE